MLKPVKVKFKNFLDCLSPSSNAFLENNICLSSQFTNGLVEWLVG